MFLARGDILNCKKAELAGVPREAIVTICGNDAFCPIFSELMNPSWDIKTPRLTSALSTTTYSLGLFDQESIFSELMNLSWDIKTPRLTRALSTTTYSLGLFDQKSIQLGSDVIPVIGNTLCFPRLV